MLRSSVGDVQQLLDARNQAQRAVELYLYEHYPIDSDEKTAALRLLVRSAAEAEQALRQYLRRPR